MIKCFNVYIYTYHNNTLIGEEVGHGHTHLSSLPNSIQNHEVKLTWDNLNDFYHEHGLDCKFNIWNLKKGRKVSFFFNGFPFKNFKDFKDVKEWENPDLNITIKYEYKEYTPSINEVLDWSDTNNAIQWLKENGVILC